jgi:hypothetical protein
MNTVMNIEFLKIMGFSWLARQLLLSHEGFCSMELIDQKCSAGKTELFNVQAVIHPSTDHVRCCFISVIGRNAELSLSYAYWCLYYRREIT